MTQSRRLAIVVSMSRGAVPVIVAVTMTPAACNTFDEPSSDYPTRAPGDQLFPDASLVGGVGGTAGIGGFAAGGFGGVTAGFGGTTGGFGGSSGDCYVVNVPPEGVPADPGQICAVMDNPVDSNRAARVSLVTSTDLSAARGYIAIDSAIESAVLALPTLEVVDATLDVLYGMQVEGLQKTDGGYLFNARWPSSIPASPDVLARMTVRTTLTLSCAADTATDAGVDSGTDAGREAGTDSGSLPGASGPTRIVHAATEIHLCSSDPGFYWASSGDQCMVCRVVAEMAPSPIVPDKTSDGLPLARALRLRIVVLARVSNTVVLLAENDGGGGLDYEWHHSGGHIERIAPDVVVWRVEQGMESPFIQAAVIGTDGAAVATFAWNEAA